MKVLFVCVHNAGRSVMAEAFARAAGLDAQSAGTVAGETPAHPEVVEAMRAVGIDVSGHRSRLLTDDMVRWADRVITMGCAVDEATCPAITLADTEDWGLPDPKGAPAPVVAAIRDRVRARVAELAG